MTVQSPPVCARCSDRPESLDKLEQHVRESQTEKDNIKVPASIVDGQPSLISLSRPLDLEVNTTGNSKSGPKLVPAWFGLLDTRSLPGHGDINSQKRRRSTLPALSTASAALSPSLPLSGNANHVINEPSSVSSKPDKRAVAVNTPISPAQEDALGSGKADALEAGDTDTNVQASTDRRSSDVVSTTDSQDANAGTRIKGPVLADAGTSTLVKRENSIAKRRRSLRKASTAASSIAAPKDSLSAPEPRGSVLPSQDTVPVRRSIVKDLANFFSGGSSRPKNVAPVRSEANNSHPKCSSVVSTAAARVVNPEMQKEPGT